MVVLFYFSNKDQPNVNKAWESEEQMLEVRMVFGFRPQCCPITVFLKSRLTIRHQILTAAR